jgi:hypothetical protein
MTISPPRQEEETWARESEDDDAMLPEFLEYADDPMLREFMGWSLNARETTASDSQYDDLFPPEVVKDADSVRETTASDSQYDHLFPPETVKDADDDPLLQEIWEDLEDMREDYGFGIGFNSYEDSLQYIGVELRKFENFKFVFGLEYPDTLACLKNLTTMIEEEGLLKDLQLLLEETMDDAMLTLGSRHPATITVMRDLAKTLVARKSFAAAVALGEEVVRSQKRLHGKNDPITLEAEGFLAGLIESSGDLEVAEEMLRQVMRTNRRLQGVVHPATVQSMNAVSDFLKRRRDYLGVLELWRPEDEATLNVIEKRSAALQEAGKLEIAVGLEMYVRDARLRRQQRENSKPAEKTDPNSQRPARQRFTYEKTDSDSQRPPRKRYT